MKPSTLASYREAIELYFSPGLGHIRLIDLQPDHFRDLYAAMRLINRPAEPTASCAETVRRLTQARARVPHVPGRLAPAAVRGPAQAHSRGRPSSPERPRAT